MTACTALLAALYAFNYGGQPAKGLDEAKVVQTLRDDAEARKVVREWTSPDGRLTLRSTETEYRRFPVTEYVPELVCKGEAPTEIVDNFRTLSLARPSGRTVLRALHGTVCSERDFAPETPVLGVGKDEKRTFEMVATEGRSSAQWMPWWGVDFPEGDGLEVGIGWTGAWRADFAADGTNFTMSAGMVKTHFRLLKGETIRQPSLLVFRRGKDVAPRAMQTLIHRFMVDVKSPRDRKGELIHGISAITAGGGNKTPAMMKKIIDWKVANQMPFDCFWVDAGWNGPAHTPDLISNCGDMWWKFVGDWRFNPTVHPDGDLGKVADAAHAAGLRMLLWMEPERCVCEPPPPVFKEHRDWLLPKNDKDVQNKYQLTLNFGDPAALNWVIETVSEHVRRCKLDVFRQDFNLNTLPLWQANDAPDRQGITEAKHIMGLWSFWDALRQRFPHLVVENCASGGRRLDFEAVSRGHSYCRTDFAIFHRDPTQIVDVQNVTLNTLAYLPFQGSESTPSVYFFDDYGIFSSFASGNVFTPSDWNAGIVKNDFTPEQTAWLREAFTTGRRMMPFYEGDFYPLTDNREAVRTPTAWIGGDREEMRWCAWQMHRADMQAGFAIFFRRVNAPYHVFNAELGGIDESADYEVETWHGKTERMSGKALRRLSVEIRRPRDFRLLFYRRLPRISEGVYTAGLYAQIPLQDITDANRATYIADAKAAGLETVILSVIDFCEEGEERRPVLDKLAREIRNFESAGFPVMVWFNAFGYGYEIPGKGARNRFGKAQRLVGVEGGSNGAVCPLDPAMRAWLKEMVVDCAKAGARVLLVDDDYVQSARGRLGCACPRHLAEVSRKVGRTVTREEVLASFAGKPNAVRSAFVDVNGEVAIELAKELRAAVDGVDPTVGMGICLSYTHWDVEGVDMDALLTALAGRTRKLVRISGAAYWPDHRFRGVGLEGVMEFVRMQSEWTRGKGWTVFDENDPYPRQVAKVPAWRCELYDKAIIADGLISRHKYMFCYGSNRSEPGYLEAHLANLPDDARLRQLFADTEPYGMRIDFPVRRIREATLPTPREREGRLTELYSQPLAAALLLRNGIPVRHDAAEGAYVFRPEDFGIDVAAVDFGGYTPGAHRRQILAAAAKRLGHPLEVYIETQSPRVYQIVRYNPRNRRYSVLLENYGAQAARVKVAVASPARVVDTLRGKFTAVDGGIEIGSLPAHDFAAVQFEAR